MNETLDILNCSPPVLLILALGVLGRGLKSAAFPPNKWIPLILPLVGAVVYPGLGAALPLPYVALLKHPWIVYAVIGFVAGGLACWGHRVVTGKDLDERPKA